LGKVKFVSVLSWKPRRGDVWGKEVWLHAFFISALDGVQFSLWQREENT